MSDERFVIEECGEGWYIRDRATDQRVNIDPIRWRPTADDFHRKLNELAAELVDVDVAV